MKKILKIVFYGYFILAGALVINFFAFSAGLTSWYDLFREGGWLGLGVFDRIWLFFVYPVLLGLVVCLSMRVYGKIRKVK